jgi:AcrR family transcriptional regulator
MFNCVSLPLVAAERTRMSTDARREQLLDSGVALLKHRPQTEVSIEEIAEAAGVSKGLLYHYFPTKTEFIVAALERGQQELAARLSPDDSLPAVKRLDASLDAFLDYVEEHPVAFASIFRGESESPAIAAVLSAGRNEQLETLLERLGEWDEAPVSVERTPELEAAAQGWIFFVEGAVLHWMENEGGDRKRLRVMLRTALGGALLAAATARGEATR